MMKYYKLDDLLDFFISQKNMNYYVISKIVEVIYDEQLTIPEKRSFILQGLRAFGLVDLDDPESEFDLSGCANPLEGFKRKLKGGEVVFLYNLN